MGELAQLIYNDLIARGKTIDNARHFKAGDYIKVRALTMKCIVGGDKKGAKWNLC